MADPKDESGVRGVIFTDIPLGGNAELNTGPIPFDRDLAKERSPLFHLMLPKPWMEWLGHIALQWGVFEVMFNEFLAAMIHGNKTVLDRPLERQSFKNRRKLFRDEFAKVPALAFLNSRFSHLIDDAARLYIERNTIVHGNISIEVKSGTGGSEFEVVSRGQHNSGPVIFRYTEHAIKVLAHDISHLAGRMWEIVKAEEPLPIEPHERRLLQDYMRDNHPNLPTGGMLLYWRPLPPPSGPLPTES